MKLIIAVVQDQDAENLIKLLCANNFSTTKLASTGGFLRQGNTTILIGVEDTEVVSVKELIEKTCNTRKKLIAPTATGYYLDGQIPVAPIEVEVGGATIFVMDVMECIKVC